MLADASLPPRAGRSTATLVILCAGSVLALLASAFMLSAIVSGDTWGIAVSVIVGWTLWLVWGVWKLHPYLSERFFAGVAIAAALIPLCDLALLAIAPQALIFVNFAALHAGSVVCAVGLAGYCCFAPRGHRLAAAAAGAILAACAFYVPDMMPALVVGIAFGIAPALAVAGSLFREVAAAGTQSANLPRGRLAA